MAQVNNEQQIKLTKNNFLTVYPEFLHRFSHMNLGMQDFIIADNTILKLYQTREKNGELDLELNKKNDELVENQVDALIEDYNNK